MDKVRRKLLAAGAAATAMATASRMLAHTGQGEGAMSFYEKGPVRIHYEESGKGFPLLLIAGGGLNSSISGLKRGDPSTQSRSSRESSAASTRTCATPTPVSPRVRSKSIGRGTRSPMTTSV